MLTHVHMQRSYTAASLDYVQPNDDVPGRQVDIPKLKRGGVKAIWLSMGAPGEYHLNPDRTTLGVVEKNLKPVAGNIFQGSTQVHRMLRGLDAMGRLCAEYSDELETVISIEQMENAAAQGKIAVFTHSEILLLGGDLSALRSYYALGMRVCGLVHSAPQEWIDSGSENRNPGGLTDFGREIIHEMNRLGMVIDLSHASEKAMWDVFEESRRPVVVSHANARVPSPIIRNLPDEILKKLADSGGVIGIHNSSAFSDINCFYGRKKSPDGKGPDNAASSESGTDDPFEYESRARKKKSEPDGTFYPTVELGKLVDQVDYMTNLIGVDHIGVGTDLGGLEDPVIGFTAVDEVPNLTLTLLSRGYSEGDTKKILGGNFIRVMREVIG